MNIHNVALLLVSSSLLAVCCPCSALPQSGVAAECSAEYENHNQIDYGPLKLSAVRGTGVVQNGGQVQPAFPGACLSLFTEEHHTFIVGVKAGSDGHFELNNLKPGRYRLIARAEGFCTANIPLEVVKSSPRKQEIVVHFRPVGIDTCSYGDFALPKGDGNKTAHTTHDSNATTP